MSTLDKQPHTATPKEREAITVRLREALKGYPKIVFAYLLGSFAEGLPFRDVDVAVWAEGVRKEQAWDYETHLSVALTRALGLEVDVRLLNFAPTGFCVNAINGVLLFSRDEERRLNFIENTSRAYMDFAWLAREMLREALR